MVEKEKRDLELKIQEYDRLNSTKLKLTLPEKIFSIKHHKEHKVITMSGIHIKIRL